MKRILLTLFILVCMPLTACAWLDFDAENVHYYMESTEEEICITKESHHKLCVPNNEEMRKLTHDIQEIQEKRKGWIHD